VKEEKEEKKPFIHSGYLHVSLIHIAVSGWFPGTLYKSESAVLWLHSVAIHGNSMHVFYARGRRAWKNGEGKKRAAEGSA